MIALQFTLGNGKIVNIGLDVDAGARLAHDMATALSASVKSAAPGGLGFTRMTPVTRVQAHPTDQPEEIALGLIDRTGLAHYFVLQKQTSSELRSSLRSAESIARVGVQLPKA
ncbi:hypothetical protein [Bradyrhizobium arachidis]|uniref:hypothetical protein n=1 Tax=Bradyrhizobium arachidis TaxID=858423 RepID=UPI0021622052|nr:hypothetical protein [Bradyrhizobium arachidis]UVO30513.1 hypothetical protein KUF59_07515 [Bradyrhizobium arachidis]